MGARAFPADFAWGVATSSHQIEGGADSRGESIWDRFEATPGKIEDGSSARVACDHYHRWQEDIGRMQWLGVNAYRFSISWPRIMPAGRGAANAEGLDFYDRLVDALLVAGITPFVTLYHWDLPQALQDEGGWSRRSVARAFVEYATAVAARLGDRVRHWITHNEPWCISILGHEEGRQAPGHSDPAEALRVAHNVLLSHGWAAATLKDSLPGAEVGIALGLTPAEPATQGDPDRDAARWFDGFFNRWYLDPLFRGHYPQDAIADRIERGHLDGGLLPFVHEGDMNDIARPIDFIGVNYYSRVVMRMGSDARPEAVPVVPREDMTDMGWEVYPSGLYELLMRLMRDYHPPKIYITENGAAYADAPGEDGRVTDVRRVNFLRGHTGAAARAIAEGVPLAGYFVWSLLDNFEWAHGYAKRFGLFWVDYATQERIPKQSAFWYRNGIANGTVDDSAA